MLTSSIKKRLEYLESQQPPNTEGGYISILEEAEPLLTRALEATEKLYPPTEYEFPDVFVIAITNALVMCDKESVDLTVARYAVKLLKERGVVI